MAPKSRRAVGQKPAQTPTNNRRGCPSKKLSKPNKLSPLPVELLSMISSHLSGRDLLSFCRTDKSCSHAASPRLYEVGVFQYNLVQTSPPNFILPKYCEFLGPTCKVMELATFPSWVNIQHINLHIAMKPRQCCPSTQYSYEQFAQIREAFCWTYPVRETCTVTINPDEGKFPVEGSRHVVAETLTGLTGFKTVTVEIRVERYGEPLDYENTDGLREILEPSLGPCTHQKIAQGYFWEPQKYWKYWPRSRLEFHPWQHDNQGHCDGQY